MFRPFKIKKEEKQVTQCKHGHGWMNLTEQVSKYLVFNVHGIFASSCCLCTNVCLQNYFHCNECRFVFYRNGRVRIGIKSENNASKTPFDSKWKAACSWLSASCARSNVMLRRSLTLARASLAGCSSCTWTLEMYSGDQVKVVCGSQLKRVKTEAQDRFCRLWHNVDGSTPPLR